MFGISSSDVSNQVFNVAHCLAPYLLARQNFRFVQHIKNSWLLRLGRTATMFLPACDYRVLAPEWTWGVIVHTLVLSWQQTGVAWSLRWIPRKQRCFYFSNWQLEGTPSTWYHCPSSRSLVLHCQSCPVFHSHNLPWNFQYTLHTDLWARKVSWHTKILVRICLQSTSKLDRIIRSLILSIPF